MSVAALPPPSLQPRMSLPVQPKRPLMMPRPSASSSSAQTLASRPVPQVKARPPQPAPPIVRRPSSTASSTPRAAPTPLPTASASSSSTPSGNKDTSSSSGKVFAKPSKEWVLPERAKPGRKVSVEEPDNKRQSQNRLSQRAHRARRTDYISTLEDRLRQYEADEIHSNVRLQEVARALKADNERLKKEVITLRIDVNDLQTQRDAWEAERQSYEEAVTRLNAELNEARGGEVSSPHFVRPQYNNRSTPLSMPTLVANTDRRPAMDCPICPDPDPDCPCQQRDQLAALPPIRPTPLAALHLAVKAMAEQDPSPTPGGDASCGVCQNHDECLCRVIGDMDEEEDIKPIIPPSPSPEIGLGVAMDDGCGLCTSASFCACKANAASSNGSSQSPMMGMMASITTTVSTAAVPLRLGRSKIKSTPIWTINPPTPSPPAKNEAECSGDPNNCEVCRDDRFGQEFCSNLYEKAETAPAEKPCTNCAGNCMSIDSLLCSSAPTQDAPSHPQHSTTENTSESHETMTADKAWKALKAHPNSKFASLSLLADVISGRTMSTGVKGDSPAHSPLPSSPVVRASPVPGPLGVVGKKRTMAVETSAVRDALRLLDSTSAPSSPAVSASDNKVDNDGLIERDAKKRKIEV